MPKSKATGKNNITIEFKPKGEKQLIAAINALSNSTITLGASQKALGTALGMTQKAQEKQIASGMLAMRNQRNMNKVVQNGSFSFSVFRSKLLLATFAVGLYAATVGRLTKAYQEQESSERRLGAAIASTGGVAGLSSEQIQKMTAAIEETGVVGDETNNSVAALLLTFTNIQGEAFERTLNSVNNMAIGIAQGIPTFENLRGAAIQLGKALQDPDKQLGALSRSGFTFTQTQKDTIKELVKQNKLFEAQSIILDAAETQFGGLQEAMRATAEGAQQGMGMAFGTLQEDLGEYFIPSLVSTANALESLFKSMSENKDTIFAFLDTTKQLIIAFGVYKVASLIVFNRTVLMAKGFAILKAVTHPAAAVLTLIGITMMSANARARALADTNDDLADAFSKIAAASDDTADAVNENLEKMKNKYRAMVLAQELSIVNIKQESAELVGLSEKQIRQLEVQEQNIRIEKMLLTIDKDKRLESRDAVKQIVQKQMAYEKYIETLKANIKAQQDLNDEDERAGKLLLNKTIDILAQQAEVQAKYNGLLNGTHNAEKRRVENLVKYNQGLVSAGRKQIDLAGAIESGQSVADFFKEAEDPQSFYNNQLIKTILLQGLYNDKLEESKQKTEELTAHQKFQQDQNIIAMQTALQKFSDFSTSYGDLVNQRMTRELEALKATRAYEDASQEERAVMENRIQQKFKSQRKKAFMINKASNMADAAMNTAEAYTKALPNVGMAAFVAALGAAQIAAIAAQPAPRFATGGSFITSGPQNMLVGESGPERVTVQPLSGLSARQGSSPVQNININVSAPLVDETILDVIIPKIEEAGRLNLA